MREVDASEEVLEELRAMNERALNRLANRLRKTKVPATPTQLAAMAIYRADSQTQERPPLASGGVQGAGAEAAREVGLEGL